MDPMTMSMLISAGTSLLGGLFGGDDEYSGPSPEQILEKTYGMGKETFDPYIKRGHEAQDQANRHYGNMTENPMDFLNQIISGYKPSEGYKFKEKHALNAARNSAAAGGISGTQNDQLGQAELVNGLLDQDMQQWLQNVLGIQGAGIGGLEAQAGRGFGASQSLAELLGNVGGSQAGLAFNRQETDRKNKGNMMGQLSGLLGAAGGAIGGSDWFKNLGGAGAAGGMLGGSPLARSPAMGGIPFKNPSIYGGFR